MFCLLTAPGSVKPPNPDRSQEEPVMRPRVVYLLALCTLAAPLSAQATPGHVYWVGFYQALPEKAGAYNKALTDVADPVLDELVRRKLMVSHVQLAQYTGT